jgi:lactoylglutathione lyase
MKIDFVTVQTADLALSIAFWEKVMGFSVTRRFSPRPGMEIAFLADGEGCQIEFIQGGETGAPGTGPAFSASGFSLGFHVGDIEATAADLRAKGAKILSGPVRMPNGLGMLRASDPNGLELGFVQEAQA